MVIEPATTVWWGNRARVAAVAIAGLLALSGCSESSTPSQEPKPVKLAQAYKVAVIRLGNPALAEPTDGDIADGIRYAGVDASSFTLSERNARGDLAAVPSLIDAAVADGANLLLTLLPETTLIASDKHLEIPLVFHMTGEPIALGLGKSDTDHPPDRTGVYTPFSGSLTVPIARGCLPKATKMGILFNPKDRYSVIHKDVLLRFAWGPVEPVTAEFQSESDVPAAVRSLVERKAEAVLLTEGIGAAAGTVIAEARRAKVPVFGYLAEQARGGAIVAREPGLRWGGFQLGRWAGRIIRGESAGQIPFRQGVDYATYVNPTAAKDLGVKILGALMRDARVVGTEAK